jgi:hypothetical protein
MLAAVMDAGDGDSVLWRLMEDGKTCRSAIGDSYLPEEWLSRGVWFSGHTLIWWSTGGAGDAGWLAGSRLPGRCARPGATGAVEPIPALPATSRVRAIDGRWLYYADAAAIRRQPLTAPRAGPPPNDDFEAATPLGGDPPLSLTVTIGNATTQPGDPTRDTVWYAFTPNTTQWVQAAGPFFEYSAAIFQGADLRSLTQLKPPALVDYDDGPAFNAIGGQTYWIAVGCHAYYSFTCYMPFELTIDPIEPPASRPARGR